MADKKGYIERGALLKEIFPYDDSVDPKCYTMSAKMIQKAIQDAPAADVVEVVRCKDCAWSRMIVVNGKPEYYCQCWNPGNSIRVNAHGFCVWGERKVQTRK